MKENKENNDVSSKDSKVVFFKDLEDLEVMNLAEEINSYRKRLNECLEKDRQTKEKDKEFNLNFKNSEAILAHYGASLNQNSFIWYNRETRHFVVEYVENLEEMRKQLLEDKSKNYHATTKFGQVSLDTCFYKYISKLVNRVHVYDCELERRVIGPKLIMTFQRIPDPQNKEEEYILWFINKVYKHNHEGCDTRFDKVNL